ncbi:hypothetical protein BKA82DRAFT_845732 [Pisolithus tinctorius]|uniref:Uncharacterized protein n=1 Tax=Pisolithus tinctorius Marx 270 TaxID=870435 RepID=A0A0C3INT9_PISTI|nr:hypothetical protein BKA82DRAFT_845732 [Pisolithus tinctorius]KIN98647.1 hypothetical protein M404DRAFT_845732 [Pisolithus tinctorius Marx 270]
MRVPHAERTTHQRGNGTTTEKKSDRRNPNLRSRSSIPSENGRRSTSSPHYYSHKWSSIHPTPISSHDFLEPSYPYPKNQEMAYDPRIHDRTPLAHLRTHVPLVRMRIHHPIRHYEKHVQGHEVGTGDTENHNIHFVERLGNVGVAQNMIGLVHDIFYRLYPRLCMALRIHTRSSHTFPTRTQRSDQSSQPFSSWASFILVRS